MKSFRHSSVKGIGATLETLIFSQNKLKKDKESIGPCWWSPPQNWHLVEFCGNTSIHGLNFIGKPRLHLSERIFWTIAFILGVVSAIFLIYDVWRRYYENPVIVSLQPKSVGIDSIPFPSATICSMNAFPKSKVKSLQRIAKGSGPSAKMANEYLKYVRSICNAQQSFAKEFNFAFKRGEDDSDLGWNETISEDSQDEMIDFLLEHTTPCKDLIRLCILGEEEIECGKIFKPIITDYGKCCSFNILPLPLLLNNPQIEMGHLTELDLSENMTAINPALGTKKRWSDEELELWKLWDYDKDGFIFENKSSTRPFRQKRAGAPYGLSILVDPNLDDWYCPVSDSEGFRFLLDNPLNFPHINEFGSFIPMNKEVFAEVRPEMTNADDDIRGFDLKYRNCYFPEERQLKYFGPYTGGNCVDECTAIILEKKCNCTYFNMPRSDNVNICNTDSESKDFKCIDDAKIDFLETLKTECAHCNSLCEDIEYKFEMTITNLQDSSQLWEDPDLMVHPMGPPSWARNRMSILHIFVGTENIVPKLRKKLHGVTDLIANTGGLLGLCLGFSVLSAAEIIYFLTLRAFCKFCWHGRRQRKCSRQCVVADSSKMERVIELRSSRIPVISLANRGPNQGINGRRDSYRYFHQTEFHSVVDLAKEEKIK